MLPAAADTAPLDLTVGRRTYRVLDRLAIGSVSTVYRCLIPNEGKPGSRPTEGLFKVARDPRTNGLIANEAASLRRLHAADAAGRFTPFLPAVEESFGVGGGGDLPNQTRQANVLRLHPDVHSPDDLYTLADVRRHYTNGLEPRHVAWVWRRLLSVLGFIHTHGVAHAAVLPQHVLVDPRDHKLILIDWCCAANDSGGATAGAATGAPVRIIAGDYLPWYRREAATRQPPTAALDVALAARTMIDLLGGDPVKADFPPAVDPALQRHFRRCLGPPSSPSAARPDAWKLLDDFDKLIDALWGPRKFHVLDMPARGRA